MKSPVLCLTGQCFNMSKVDYDKVDYKYTCYFHFIPQYSCLTGQCINLSKVNDDTVDSEYTSCNFSSVSL